MNADLEDYSTVYTLCEGLVLRLCLGDDLLCLALCLILATTHVTERARFIFQNSSPVRSENRY